ncbi:MAG TPA: DMT family transporter [Granulicella sp.]
MDVLLQGNVLLALCSALLWGGGDFSGGMGVKAAGGSTGGALRIVILSHLTSLTALSIFLLLRGTPLPHGTPLAWALAAGAMAGVSLAAFYIALARGAMGISAAISGLLAAAIPAAVSAFTEGSPGLLRIAGFVVAGVAIWMIAAGPEPAGGSSKNGTMLLAVLAGAGFGVYFVALKMAGSLGPPLTMATARVGSIVTCTTLLLALSLKGNLDKGKITAAAIRWVLLTALMDTGGNMLFVAATQAGRLDVASVLASLYPASTILLAAWMLKERPTRMQGIGMLVAAAAVVMITL